MVGAWQGRDIPRLNSAAEPPRHRRDKGGEMAERSSAMALNGVDSPSAGPGFMALEWFRNKPIIPKVDIYNFGVLVLEFICCRKNVEPSIEDENKIILTGWAYDKYKEGSLDLLIENDKEARNDMKRVEKFAMTAIWCIW
uniref:Serine-threonine/tyrosine-protein kinase catalytic domain-containing protein n=1 Tax=Quercus lobata TaxID=97700 RepID=A0A7N2QXF5_QUELO